MDTDNEIEAVLRSEVAKCKAIDPRSVNVNDPLIEVIGLHGDDFMAIADYVHEKYGVHPPRDAYRSRMTIKDWAEILSDASTHQRQGFEK